MKKSVKHECIYCRKNLEMKAMHGHVRFSHPDEYESEGWPKIKAKILIGSPEENVVRSKKSEKKPEDPNEVTGSEQDAPESVDIEFEQERELGSESYIPKAPRVMKLDSRIYVMYNVLRQKGIIPNEWKITDFINKYVLGHVAMKDRLNLAVTQTIMGSDGSKTVYGMENINELDEDGNMTRRKSPEELMEEIQKQRLTDTWIKKQLKEIDAEEKKNNPSPQSTALIDRVSALMDKVQEQKMMADLIKSIYGTGDSNNGKQSKEVESLKEQIAKMQQEKQIDAFKNSIEKLADEMRNIKGGKEVGTKDLVQMMMLNQKQQGDFKDTLNQKAMESLMEKQQHSNELLANELKNIKERPSVVSQVQELQATKEALQKFGALKSDEKSGQEIISDLIGHVSDTMAPYVGRYLESQAQMPQPPTQEELARMRQIQQQTNPQPAEMLPNPEPRPKPQPKPEMAVPETNPIPKSILDNMLAQQFGGDGAGSYRNTKREE